MTLHVSHKLWTNSSFGMLLVMSSCLLGVTAACDGADDDDTTADAKAGSASSPSSAGEGAGDVGGSANHAGTSGADSGGQYGVAGNAASEGGSSASSAGASNAGASGDEATGGGGEPTCVPEPPTLPTDVPEQVQAPENVSLVRHFHAVGTQNYRCTPSDGADPTYSWVFIAPVADLLNSCGKIVGSHFAVPDSAPPQPEWRYAVDGSSVIGAKVDASPVDGAIPELLLKEAGHSDAGVFSTVTFVQRLDTAGGAAPPAGECDAEHVDEERDVGYTAEYYFYSGGT